MAPFCSGAAWHAVLRKYEAITGAGITVMKRVDLPDDFIKARDWVFGELDSQVWMTTPSKKTSQYG